jgi:hypothetical protein
VPPLTALSALHSDLHYPTPDSSIRTGGLTMSLAALNLLGQQPAECIATRRPRPAFGAQTTLNRHLKTRFHRRVTVTRCIIVMQNVLLCYILERPHTAAAGTRRRVPEFCHHVHWLAAHGSTPLFRIRHVPSRDGILHDRLQHQRGGEGGQSCWNLRWLAGQRTRHA